jgi:catechol 2,3-dioxygenase-like lactoylglutathione lyase family enzyme
MAIAFNHTIVHARDRRASANFLASLFGLPEPKPFGPFLDVDLSNGVTLAYLETDEDIQTQHYAFLVSEDEFDAIFGRIRESGLTYWADPARSKPGEINHHFGGRGVYFEDPAKNLMEIITRPYGSG